MKYRNVQNHSGTETPTQKLKAAWVEPSVEILVLRSAEVGGQRGHYDSTAQFGKVRS
jgi:hypothetical protein